MEGVDGLVAAAMAAVAAYQLYRIQLADATRGRRAIRLALAVALLLHAGVLLSAVVSSSRSIALRVEETSTKLLQIEEIIQDREKQNYEMLSYLASMLSKDPGHIQSMSYNRSTSPDGAENAEVLVTMKGADVHQPSTESGHTGKIKEAPPMVMNDQAAPVADTHGEALGAQQHKPWRGFLIPSDHVFVLDCVNDELTVRIRPPVVGINKEESVTPGASCRIRQQQEGMVPFLYSGARDYMLFMSTPGEQRVVPVPWPRPEMYRKLTWAILRGEELPIAEETEVVPESFTLCPDVVAFYYQTKQGMTAMIIMATDTVERVELEEEVAVGAVKALNPPDILSISFPDLIQ